MALEQRIVNISGEQRGGEGEGALSRKKKRAAERRKLWVVGREEGVGVHYLSR